jgi:hypothetical protein
MNILRAFGEQIGIFTSPKDSADKKPALVRMEPAELDQDEPLIQVEVPHCCFYCGWCSGQILLPHDSLGFAFGGPMIRKIEARSVGTVCPSCGHTGTFSLFRGCHGYDTRHRFVPSPPRGKTVLLDWLPCQADSCVFKLPFFVTYDDALTEANLKEWAPKWTWDQLACSVGHTIQAPKWIFEMRPHRAAIDLARAGVQRLR